MLFLGRKPDDIVIREDEASCKACPWFFKPRFWTYFYFAVVLSVGLLWGIAVFWDNFWYRKTNTCNDINVKHNEYICYKVEPPNYPIANCQALVNSGVDVLCYLEARSISTGLGIGFSIFQFVLLIGKIGFSIAVWFGGRQEKDSRWSHGFAVTAGVLGIVAFVSMTVYAGIVTTVFETDPTWNIFFGHPPLRWWMYGLLLFSFPLILLLLGIFAYMYREKPKFQEMARVVQHD